MEHDLNNLVIFTRVIEEGSFTAAARALGLPKSTVSRRISKLENGLGVRLIQRNTRKIGLTDAGRVYYESSAKIVDEFERAGRAVMEMQEMPKGRLRLTAPAELGVELGELLLVFLDRYPEIQVDLDLSGRYVDLVKEEFDVAIRAGSAGNWMDSSLICRKLFQAPSVLVASPDYLDKYGIPEDIAALSEHDFVIFGTSTYNATCRLREQDGSHIHIRVSGRLAANHFETLKTAVKGGYGIAQIPYSLCYEEIQRGEFISILPDACPDYGTIWLVYPSRDHLAPKVRVFIDFCVENMRSFSELMKQSFKHLES